MAHAWRSGGGHAGGEAFSSRPDKRPLHTVSLVFVVPGPVLERIFDCDGVCLVRSACHNGNEGMPVRHDVWGVLDFTMLMDGFFLPGHSRGHLVTL